jgi:hypothetical protein
MTESKKYQSAFVVLGYISCLFAGLIGMFIGAFVVSAKKTLPGGRTAYAFDEKWRKHGKIILYLGSSILILSILFFMNWFFLEKVLFGRPLR